MYQELIKETLKEFRDAIDKLEEETSPSVPFPERFKYFYFCDGIVWPCESSAMISLYEIMINGQGYSLRYKIDKITDGILMMTHNNPRKILRAIRRIQAATAWCLARAEGRKRAAQEILRQQANAAEN